MGYDLLTGWLARRRTPSADDEPIDILYKLDRQRLGIRLARVNVTVEGAAQPGYALEPWHAGAEKVWVGPPILLTWNMSKIVDDKDKDLYQQIVQHLEPGARASELAGLVKEGKERGILDVRWGRLERLDKPYQAKAAEGGQGSGLEPNSIVQQE